MFRKANVTPVTYAYGDEFGECADLVKKMPKLIQMAVEYGEFRV